MATRTGARGQGPPAPRQQLREVVDAVGPLGARFEELLDRRDAQLGQLRDHGVRWDVLAGQEVAPPQGQRLCNRSR